MAAATKGGLVTHITSHANAIGNTTAAGTVFGGGALYWLDEHAAAVGALGVILGLIATIVFKTVGHLEQRRHNREMEKKK